MRQDYFLDPCLVDESVKKLNQDVLKFGKLLKSFVKFMIAFFFFVLLNLGIVIITKHANLLSVQTFQLVEEGLHVYINESLVAFASIISERHVSFFMIMTFALAFGAIGGVHTFVPTQTDDDGDAQVQQRDDQRQDAVEVPCVVSYKQKVRFLS